MAYTAGKATKSEGNSTIRKNITSVIVFLEIAMLEPLNLLSKKGQTFLVGSFNLGPSTVITAKIVKETAINMKLTKTSGPSPKFSARAWAMKTGPFSKIPATIKVAPVSEIDLAKARMKDATRLGFKIERVTVLSAVKGGAPKVLDASSYTI